MAASKILGSPTTEAIAQTFEVPIDPEGHFSFNEARAVIDSGEGYYTPVDGWGRLLSPMESGTDVVLPIVAIGEGKSKPSRHHAYFYERHYKRGSAAVQATRYSRLQRVALPAHKQYHRRYFGTLAPSDEAAATRAIILNTAGYIANMGVIIDGEEATIREITRQERNRLRRPNVFTLEKSKRDQIKIGQFLMGYALSQGFDHVKESQIEEFLELTPRRVARDERLRARKLQLGLRLTNIAIGTAVDPVETDYRTARKNYSLRRGAPSTAWHWVKSLLGGREIDYLPTLEDRLVDEYYAVAA